MYRKAIYLVVAFFCLNVALSGLTSCQPGCGSDHCNIPRCLRTGVISLTAKDGTFDDPIINAGEPVLATNLHFELLVTGNIEVCYQQPGRKTYSLFSSAYACSPAPSRTYFGADSIVSCAIYTITVTIRCIRPEPTWMILSALKILARWNYMIMMERNCCTTFG